MAFQRTHAPTHAHIVCLVLYHTCTKLDCSQLLELTPAERPVSLKNSFLPVNVVSVRGCVCLLRVCLSVVVKNFTVNNRPRRSCIQYGTSSEALFISSNIPRTKKGHCR